VVVLATLSETLTEATKQVGTSINKNLTVDVCDINMPPRTGIFGEYFFHSIYFDDELSSQLLYSIQLCVVLEISNGSNLNAFRNFFAKIHPSFR
jgi:hypothetical protein